MSERQGLQIAGPFSIPVMQCPVAGFQYHGGEACWQRMGPGDPLVLRREPGNRHDPRAIVVQWRDVTLGYIPREANYALSQMLDGGNWLEARIQALRAGGDPWQRVIIQVTWIPPQRVLDYTPAEFLPPLLIRSLANRVFGPKTTEASVDWIGPRAAAIALVGVEQPAMLPFLRLVAADEKAARNEDPLAALHLLLLATGVLPEAWNRLPRWGFDAFAGLGVAPIAPLRIARFANLLYRLGVSTPPPRHFGMYAFTLGLYRAPPRSAFDVERHPIWFTRALLRAVEGVTTPAGHTALRAELRMCLDWLIDTSPSPDANQQHAGWGWIVEQGRAHRKARRLAWIAPWPVPCRGIVFGSRRVVPMRCAAELAEEAEAMRNCLEDYEDDCRSGHMVVFSIRDQLTDERLACFAIEREGPGDDWEVMQVAGRMNAKVDEGLAAIAEIVADRLSRPSAAADQGDGFLANLSPWSPSASTTSTP